MVLVCPDLWVLAWMGSVFWSFQAWLGSVWVPLVVLVFHRQLWWYGWCGVTFWLGHPFVLLWCFGFLPLVFCVCDVVVVGSGVALLAASSASVTLVG
ncbi:hypothetical protein TSUD_131170 [Trifolium subterraneum]|uniref:Transmembrane protein n=1 Tax=Trifolium subterraneum TaxID=3900 RepID=A0A2Z6PD88_TRISU|nr:hypothetical protein TSUD_131170 [Trifolium subterraneum]